MIGSGVDSAWKDLMVTFAPQMLESVSPEIAEQIDGSRKIRQLDKELRKLSKILGEKITDAEMEADVLLELPMKDGKDALLLLHIEIQGKGSHSDINRRMYLYRCAIELKYRQPMIGMLIATEPIGKIGEYSFQAFGNKVVYKYNVLEINKLSEARLKESKNPFDTALLAALKTLKNKKANDSEKLSYLKEFLRLLKERNYTHEQKWRLVAFIEQITKISDESVLAEYDNFMIEVEERVDNMLISRHEQRLIARCMEKGVEKDIEKSIGKWKLDVIKKMFSKNMPISEISFFTETPEEKIRSLVKSVRKLAMH